MTTACASAPETRHSVDRYLGVDGGVRLRYRDEGQGSAVLLVHGWTLDLEMWDSQVESWRDSFRLLRLDRRGHGLSGEHGTASGDAQDLAVLCRHLQLAQVAVLGMSQGVRSALAFAAAAPTTVSALILDGPPQLAHSTPEDDVPLSRYRALLRTQGIDALRREWSRHPLMQLWIRDPAKQALLAAMLGRYRGEDLRTPDSAAEAADLMIESITAPALVVSGEHDLAARVRAADHLCTRLERGERTIIAGAGHLANLDNPQAYNDRCRAFLTRHLGARTPS